MYVKLTCYLNYVWILLLTIFLWTLIILTFGLVIRSLIKILRKCQFRVAWFPADFTFWHAHICTWIDRRKKELTCVIGMLKRGSLIALLKCLALTIGDPVLWSLMLSLIIPWSVLDGLRPLSDKGIQSLDWLIVHQRQQWRPEKRKQEIKTKL